MANEAPVGSREEALLQQLERERALRRQAEEEKERERDLRQQAEAENARFQKQLQPTTLPEFLDACHVYLSVGFSSRINYKTGTQGNPENAYLKLRPDYIREWTTFSQEQSEVWRDLFSVDFASEPHFTSLNTLKEMGNDLQVRSMGSELDLNYYERYAVEDRVSLIIRNLFSDDRLRKIFNLGGDVTFENHGNTITTEERGAEPTANPDIGSPQQSPVQKRRKKADMHGDSLPATPTVRSRSSRPRADQFCVYNTGPERAIPAFIIEYKAPHKLTLAIIEAGLMEMDVDDVVIYNESDDPVKLAQRRVAAVISQAFSYMIQAELEFGYVCTGEAFIFLRVPSDDPATVYYYLSTPNEDVGETTGWAGGDSANRLHLTAIGQVLAFTLRALKSQPHGQVWRNNAEAQLKRWEIEQDDVLFGSDIEESTGKKLSDYKQDRKSRNEYIRVSPIKTRSKSKALASCRDPEERPTGSEPSDDGDDDDSSGSGGFDPGSPSSGLPRRASNVTAVTKPPPTGSREHKYSLEPPVEPTQFCTQKCLLGLFNRGPLDQNCPHVASHGVERHAIDDREFRRLVRAQILADSGPSGCESMHLHGTSGALFWLTLFPYGYTLVAKAMPVETVKCALYEERIYQHLRPIQGIYIPVCLGSVDISSRPLWYDGIFEVVHLLLLGHAGRLVKFHAGANNLRDFAPSACESLRAIHKQHALHRDAHSGNMFWNAENKQVMFVDFERARVVNSQTKKRKRGTLPLSSHGNTEFEREIKSVERHMGFR
ncbi:hypothetical protein H105_07348 [Trichophyton soudanense CBS 452.61]|uniref:Protein kinase domain-containing protein n=1 Tax=Trichophyton soudanense CBS 452.61 TaxID=1215331 RepID=A0A022XIU9_TRISD|nr:hypothetical protein H105_07348 [Trichophyton soudanense CBS 452.61]EZG02807.1 hypothetical protein H106_07170 [Trichophyton rubrum CBS 735.88]